MFCMVGGEAEEEEEEEELLLLLLRDIKCMIERYLGMGEGFADGESLTCRCPLLHVSRVSSPCSSNDYR